MELIEEIKKEILELYTYMDQKKAIDPSVISAKNAARDAYINCLRIIEEKSTGLPAGKYFMAKWCDVTKNF